jgi:hypothetical protein
MHLDESLDQREPEAEAALAPVQRRIGLRERLEDPRQHLRRNSRPGVAHAQDGLLEMRVEPRPRSRRFRERA